jgi:hypothetical protein
VGGGGGVAGSQPMSSAVHRTGAQIGFGDITSYLTHALNWLKAAGKVLN